MHGILQSYVDFVHPFLPILDLNEFLQAILKNEPAHQLSLLVFQAVMFAGSAFVKMSSLKIQGFSTQKEFEKAHFPLVELLYDFDLEINRIVLAQTTLLMSFWYESPDSPRDA